VHFLVRRGRVRLHDAFPLALLERGLQVGVLHDLIEEAVLRVHVSVGSGRAGRCAAAGELGARFQGCCCFHDEAPSLEELNEREFRLSTGQQTLYV
jgi:hypothetical protein